MYTFSILPQKYQIVFIYFDFFILTSVFFYFNRTEFWSIVFLCYYLFI